MEIGITPDDIPPPRKPRSPKNKGSRAQNILMGLSKNSKWNQAEINQDWLDLTHDFIKKYEDVGISDIRELMLALTLRSASMTPERETSPP